MQDLVSLFEQIEFIALVAIVLVLAFLALEHKEITYAAFFFGFMAAATAGFFLLLDAPFVAGAQIAVYTGGISALIVFAVLLLPRVQDSSLEVFESPKRKQLGMILAVSVMALSGTFALLFSRYLPIPVGNPESAQSLEALAEWLWGSHGIYVQILGLIMVTTIVGAVAIMRLEKAARLESIAHHEPGGEDKLGTAGEASDQ